MVEQVLLKFVWTGDIRQPVAGDLPGVDIVCELKQAAVEQYCAVVAVGEPQHVLLDGGVLSLP